MCAVQRAVVIREKAGPLRSEWIFNIDSYNTQVTLSDLYSVLNQWANVFATLHAVSPERQQSV